MGILKPKKGNHKTIVKSIQNYMAKELTAKVMQTGQFKPDLNIKSGKPLDLKLYEIALVADTFSDGFDNVIAESYKIFEKNNVSLACKAGCHKCCSQPLAGNYQEVIRMFYFLQADPELQEEFMNKYPKWREQVNPEAYLKALHNLDVTGDMQHTMNQADEPVEKYDNGKLVWCPFLSGDEGDESRICNIYESRPFACRSHFVRDSNENCGRHADGIGYMPNTSDIQAAMFKNSSVSTEIANILGIDNPILLLFEETHDMLEQGIVEYFAGKGAK